VLSDWSDGFVPFRSQQYGPAKKRMAEFVARAIAIEEPRFETAGLH